MAETRSEIRQGAYYDSVVLMQLQRSLAELPGVEDAGVVMATPANCEILQASGLPIEKRATSEDLLIVVRAINGQTAEDALAQVDSLLATRRSSTISEYRPRSLGRAVEQLPSAQWVLISTPGRFAAEVAKEALSLGRNVFLFSDNVPLESEIKLKKQALDLGLLLMGPDCGTAIIGGVGFGFANRVREGTIGIVGASGTGMQAISSAIHNAGAGISQALGTGGRDLKQDIAAIAAHQGLELLASDPKTDVIILISKPPHSKVAAGLLNHAMSISKPVVIDFIGQAPPAKKLGNLHFATSLQDAAEIAVTLSQTDGSNPRLEESILGKEGVGGRYIRGLFSGGTLAYEAVVVLTALSTDIYSNVPYYEWQKLHDVTVSHKNTILDLGEDEFTQGRLHPMMDNDLRLRRLTHEASDPEVGAIILDLVLGEGSHPDPASEIAPALENARQIAADEGRELAMAVITIGTDADDQGIDDQIERLTSAGALIFNNAPEAVYHVYKQVGQAIQYDKPTLSLNAFSPPVAAINVGLEVFYNSLKAQGADVVQVDWRPPAGGNEKLMSLLSQLK